MELQSGLRFGTLVTARLCFGFAEELPVEVDQGAQYHYSNSDFLSHR